MLELRTVNNCSLDYGAQIMDDRMARRRDWTWWTTGLTPPSDTHQDFLAHARHHTLPQNIDVAVWGRQLLPSCFRHFDI